MKCHFDCIERPLSKGFCRYARIVSHWPLPFIVVPVLVSISLSFGFVWNFQVVKDDLDLYTPIDGQSKTEKRSLQKYFDINDTDPYFAQRRFDSKRIGFIIVTMKEEDQNVLNAEAFEEISILWDRIERMQFSKNDQLYNYSDLCIRIADNSCIANPLLTIYRGFRKRQMKYIMFIDTVRMFFESLTLEKYLVYTPPFTEYKIFIANVIGTLTDKNLENRTSNMIETKAILLPYQLKFHDQTLNELAEKWENVLNNFLLTYKTENISLHWWTSETLTIETKKETQLLLKLLAPMFLLVTAFTVACCFVKDPLRSKPWLGLCGIASTALSVISSLGILLICGAKLTSVTYFVPFLTFSIGVDNVFIFIGAWRKSSVFSSVEDRMVHTFEDAAVAITVTSLTDAVSFAIGCMSTYPSIRSFCLYSCVAIIFVYINHLMFFAGCMVVSGKRESMFCSGITFRVMTERMIEILKEKSELTVGHHVKDFTDEGISDNAAARFFKGPYVSFLLHEFTVVVIFVLLFAYLGFAVLGVRNVVIGIHPTDLLSSKSPARNSLTLQTKYFSDFSDNLHLWYIDMETYNDDLSVWDQLDNEVKTFEFTKYSFTAESWYREFLNYKNASFINVTAENFVTIVNEWQNQKKYSLYQKDIHFVNESGKLKISAVRFVIRLCNVTFVNQYVATHLFRKLVKGSKFNAYIYNEFFEFGDQFDSIVPNLFSNIAIGSAAVVVVSLLLIPKPLCAIWVCVTIISINVGILGYMSWWNVHLDFISMVTIVMSIGASVNFSAHIAYHFAKSELVEAKDRIRDSLYVVGTPILQSAFSTWLGITLIAVIDSYSFRAFVKTTLLVILFGLMHGLIVLPVLLAVFHSEKEPKASQLTSSGLDCGGPTSDDQEIKTDSESTKKSK